MYKFKIIVLTLYIVSFGSYSQQSSVAEFMDDGGRSTTKNIIKTDFAEIINANIPVIWEHRLNNNFAFQIGFGVLTNNFFPPIFKANIGSNNPKMYEELNSGFSLFLSPLIYKSGFESAYLAFPLKFSNYTGQVISYEVSSTIGKQWFLLNHLSLDLNIGIGLFYEKSYDNKSYVYDPKTINNNKFNRSIISFPISAKLGYVL